MSAKHAPNRFSSYLAIHETVMERFRREGFVLSNDLDVAPFGLDALEMTGTIRCLGALVITVRKILRLASGQDSDDPLVETVLYSYNASVAGHSNLLRYDNAHVHPGHLDRHHRHAFDWRTGETLGVTWIGPAWPTLGEVIQETRDWYWEHHTELAAE